MQVLLSQLNAHLSGVWRFRWTMLISAWLLSVAGWIFVYQMPEEYMATARVHIDSNNVLRPLLRGLAIQPNVSQRVTLMSQTLLSRPNLEKLMRMTDLDLQVKTDIAKEKLLAKLGKTISLAGERRNPSLYSLAFKHPNRDTAKRIVQSLISVFIESVLGDKRVDSADAQEFLDQQIAEYEERLAEAESRLADFKRRYAGTMPGTEGGYYQRMEEAKALLNAAQLQLKEMENRRSDLENQIEDADDDLGFVAADIPEVISPYDIRIQSLQGKMDELLLRYTERHPEVRQIRSIIADLEKSKQEEAEQAKDEPASQENLQASPVYQQMRAMLAETEAGIAELKVRVVEYGNRAQEMEKRVDSIPLIEAELQQLNRDYTVISAQHSDLLKRRESARMSQQVEQSSDDVKFRVIDPPFVPLKPTEPNKLLLSIAVLFIAVGLGIGIAFLLSVLRPVISDRYTMGQVTGLPVLGSVSIIKTAVQKRKELFGKLMFASMSLCLLLVFAGINLKYGLDIDLVAKLEQLKAGLL
jgi:polysaccharide chain length determinant protein (PEP-CTERM system associated)